LGGTPFIHDCCQDPTFGFTNTFVGVSAGNFATNGIKNTATGGFALFSITSGDYNTASGFLSLETNATGNNNTAVGYSALLQNTASDNTAIGDNALVYNTGGTQNTAVGEAALAFNGGGSDNTAVGIDALYTNSSSGNSAVGQSSLWSNTSGFSNTAIGQDAGFNNTTGSDNTFLGADSGPSSGALFNATAIGAYATVSESDALVLGGTGINAVHVGIGTPTPSNVLTIAQGSGAAIADGWMVYSSRRWKSGIHPLYSALGKVEQLRGVEYTYTPSGKRDIGVIAEDVGRVVPEAVSYEKNGKDARGVDYARLTALLIEAVKQQQTEIKQQGAEISRLESEIRVLQGEKK
jgi:hypothetical protein